VSDPRLNAAFLASEGLVLGKILGGSSTGQKGINAAFLASKTKLLTGQEITKNKFIMKSLVWTLIAYVSLDLEVKLRLHDRFFLLNYFLI